MRDFTLSAFRHLLEELLQAGYSFLPFCEFLSHRGSRTIVLRHDVDARKLNSLQIARIDFPIHLDHQFRRC